MIVGPGEPLYLDPHIGVSGAVLVVGPFTAAAFVPAAALDPLGGGRRRGDRRAGQSDGCEAEPTPGVLREAVERLKVDEVAGAQFHHLDHHLADQIEELADAC